MLFFSISVELLKNFAYNDTNNFILVKGGVPMETRAGKYISNLSGDMEYMSFLPTSLPPSPEIELDKEMVDLLVTAHGNIKLLDGLTSYIPNIELYVSMYVRKEALLSSQIEGAQASLDDILDPEIDKNKNLHVEDVVNYIKATNYALRRMNSLPLCNRLLKETHAVLLDNVRGQEKSPGEFRTSQNWIGGYGSSLATARYIPPNPTDMTEAMSELEKYINTDDDIDHLIRIALIHYQFETIHPFLDGNGRIGRLLIILYLIEKKILSAPTLYLSLFLKQNRIEYYDRMTEVRRTGNYEQWVKFFLQAVAESSADAIRTIEQLSAVHEETGSLVAEHFSTRALKNANTFFSYLEQNPIIDIQRTAAALGLSYNTVAKLVAEFCELGILQKYAKTYSYEKYLAILRKDTEL